MAPQTNKKYFGKYITCFVNSSFPTQQRGVSYFFLLGGNICFPNKRFAWALIEQDTWWEMIFLKKSFLICWALIKPRVIMASLTKRTIPELKSQRRGTTFLSSLYGVNQMFSYEVKFQGRLLLHRIKKLRYLEQVGVFFRADCTELLVSIARDLCPGVTTKRHKFQYDIDEGKKSKGQKTDGFKLNIAVLSCCERL